MKNTAAPSPAIVVASKARRRADSRRDPDFIVQILSFSGLRCRTGFGRCA